MMRNKLIFMIAAGGFGYIGYIIGHNVSRKKYENLADVEVASVKEKLAKHYESKLTGGKSKEVIKDNKPLETEQPNTKKISTLVGIAGKDNKPLSLYDYGAQYRTQTTSTPERIVGEPSSDKDLPYIITPDEFVDSHYETTTLLYFADKVLTDDDMNVINNINIIGGIDNLNSIGMYESDVIHIRDAKLGVDYEVIMDERYYSKLRPVGVEASEGD